MKVDNDNRTSYNLQNSNPMKKDSLIEAIKKQIKAVQDQMGKVSGDKSLSAEEKQNIQEALSDQLDELNKQLVQRNLDIQKQEREKRERELQKNSDSAGDEYTADGKKEVNLVSLSSSLKQLSIHHATSRKMSGRVDVLEYEIKADASRGFDVSAKQDELSEIKEKIKNINKQIQNKLQDVQSELRKGIDPSKEKKDKIDAEKTVVDQSEENRTGNEDEAVN